MVLTLHNITMMQKGKLPFHGAFVRIVLRDGIDKNVLIIGDTGAGKSEMLEAFRVIGADVLRDMIVIADDMGSINFGPPQYREVHDRLAHVFFNAFFSKGIFVGQIRTRLGITGFETAGPESAARELLRVISSM